ncbi:MAG: efflux RND transporter periplasmic adaptor subunit, partial [Planctomycetota bacterium]
TWQSRLRLLIGSLLVVAGVLSVIGAIAWTKMQQLQAAMAAPPPPEMPVAVTVAEALPIQFRRETVVIGTVLSHQSVLVRNELTGVVTQVAMAPGGNVKAGDLLVQLDDRTERAELKAAEATVVLAEATLLRARKLKRADANSDRELDIAQADAARAQAEVDRLRSIIDRKKIVSKFDARVGLFELHPGQYLVEGTDIVALEGLANYVNIDFAMPAHVADAVSLGQSVTLRTGEQTPPLSADIVAMDSRADPSSRSLKARAKLIDPPASIVAGDSMRVTIRYGGAIDALSIPSTAIRRTPAGTMVYVAREEPSGDGPPAWRAEPRTVQIAGGDGTQSRVVSGLRAGDRVVSDGSFKVIEGSLLSLTQESKP